MPFWVRSGVGAGACGVREGKKGVKKAGIGKKRMCTAEIGIIPTFCIGTGVRRVCIQR